MCVCSCPYECVTVNCEGLKAHSKSMKAFFERGNTFLTSLGFLPALGRNIDAPVLNSMYTPLKCGIHKQLFEP